MGGPGGEDFDPDEAAMLDDVKEGNEIMVFDWDMLQTFSERILSLFEGYATKDPKNPKNGFLDVKEMRKLKNPDVVEVLE